MLVLFKTAETVVAQRRDHFRRFFLCHFFSYALRRSRRERFERLIEERATCKLQRAESRMSRRSLPDFPLSVRKPHIENRPSGRKIFARSTHLGLSLCNYEIEPENQADRKSLKSGACRKICAK
jgi:hypothetical protein